MTKISTVLRDARLSKGLSLRDMTRLSDGAINGNYIGLIEDKGAIPSPKKIRVISKILKLDFLELMILAGHVSHADFKTKE